MRELEDNMARRGRPVTCVSDNGAELIGMAGLRFWCQELRIAPGEAMQKRSSKASTAAVRRAPQRAPVHVACAGSRHAGGVDGRLKHRSPTQRARRPHTERICRPPRCSTEPAGLIFHRALLVGG